MPVRFPRFCVEQRILPEEIAGLCQIVEVVEPGGSAQDAELE